MPPGMSHSSCSSLTYMQPPAHRLSAAHLWDIHETSQREHRPMRTSYHIISRSEDPTALVVHVVPSWRVLFLSIKVGGNKGNRVFLYAQGDAHADIYFIRGVTTRTDDQRILHIRKWRRTEGRGNRRKIFLIYWKKVD